MMTEEQRLINEALKTSRDYLTEQAQFTVERLKEYDKCSERMFALMALEYMRLAALTQPARPALKLPDGWRLLPDEPTEEMMRAMYQAQDMWPSAHCDNMRETQMSFARPRYIAALATAPKAPSVPHTAPIEPICATGGAEWVKLEDELPKDGSWCIAIEEGDFAGDVVYWGNGEWRSEFGRDEYTHWMYHPAAPES